MASKPTEGASSASSTASTSQAVVGEKKKSSRASTSSKGRPRSPSPYRSRSGQSTSEFVNEFWQHTVSTAEALEEDFKHQALPLARIKKVMKSDPEVRMISSEVTVLFEKACQIFIQELTARSHLVSLDSRRRTLSRPDVAQAISKSDMFDFLIDIVPREEGWEAESGSGVAGGVKKRKKSTSTSSAKASTSAGKAPGTKASSARQSNGTTEPPAQHRSDDTAGEHAVGHSSSEQVDDGTLAVMEQFRREEETRGRSRSLGDSELQEPPHQQSLHGYPNQDESALWAGGMNGGYQSYPQQPQQLHYYHEPTS